MKKSLTIGAALLVAACASTPTHTALVNTKTGRPDVYFYDTNATSVSGKLAATCMDSGLTVVNSTTNMVTCESKMSMGQSVLTQMAIGNSYSTTPRQFVQMSIAQIGDDVRVQATSWAETQMAFGQVNRMQTDQTPQQISGLTAFLMNAGGKLAPGDSMTFKGPRIGVRFFEVNGETKQNLGFAGALESGLYVVDISEDMPAYGSGIEICDRVISLNGTKVIANSDIAINDEEPQTFLIVRDSAEHTFVVTPIVSELTMTGKEMSNDYQEFFQKECLAAN